MVYGPALHGEFFWDEVQAKIAFPPDGRSAGQPFFPCCIFADFLVLSFPACGAVGPAGDCLIFLMPDNLFSPGERIDRINVAEEIRNSFLDYSMSVIISRALPDVRDGLKPSQRRILYAMHELGLCPGPLDLQVRRVSSARR